MSVGIGSYYPYSNAAASYPQKAAAKEKSGTEKTNDNKVLQKPEVYKPDMDKINAINAENKNNVMAFKQMLYSMLKQQSGYVSAAFKPLSEIDTDTQLAAQEAISKDGYWGVNQTAERILDFAKAISGGDPSKIAELRDAVEKGYAAAERAFGDKLPDVSYQTKQKVMEGFDEWKKSGKL